MFSTPRPWPLYPFGGAGFGKYVVNGGIHTAYSTPVKQYTLSPYGVTESSDVGLFLFVTRRVFSTCFFPKLRRA